MIHTTQIHQISDNVELMPKMTKWIARDFLGYRDDEVFDTRKEALECARMNEDDDCLESLAELNIIEVPDDT